MSTVRSTSTPQTSQSTPTARPAQGNQMAQPSSGTSRVPSDRIAQRAYEKWMKRGCVHGYDQQDWVDAERELLAEQNRSASASGQQAARR